MAEDQRTVYIALVGGVLSIVVLLLGTGLVVYLRRRKNRHSKQVAAMLPGGVSGLNKLPVTMGPSSTGDKRMTLLSLKQLGKTNSLAPSARDGFYGPVMTSSHESDSDTSSFYHEPYNQQQPVIKYNTGRGFQRSYCSSAADPEYGCLIQKEPLVLTPKGLHSKGIYHKLGNHPPAMPLPRPPLSAVKQSLLMADTPQSTTSFTAVPSENYYATTDLIHVSIYFA